MCPSGRAFNGQGNYCLQGDVWQCNAAQQPALQKMNTCTNGCSLNQYSQAVCNNNNNNPVCPTGSRFYGNGNYCLSGDVWQCSGAGANADQLWNSCGGNGCTVDYNGKGQCNSNTNPTCPGCVGCQGSWNGQGDYCLQGDIWSCDSAQAPAVSMANSCGANGCTANTYANGASVCNNNNNNNALAKFNVYNNYAVSGGNDKILYQVPTPDRCAQNCMNEQSFHCASFDYAPSSGQCVLSHTSTPTTYASGWNLYLRNAY